MEIRESKQHYGSALIQIAEDPEFTAINAFYFKGEKSKCGFRVNNDIGVYFRFRSKPKGKRVKIYRFTVSQDNLEELKKMRRKCPHLFLALICVKAKAVCCFPYEELLRFVQARFRAKGWDEKQYTIEVNIEKRKQFHVWMSPPREKGIYLVEAVIPRSDFPSRLFKDV